MLSPKGLKKATFLSSIFSAHFIFSSIISVFKIFTNKNHILRERMEKHFNMEKFLFNRRDSNTVVKRFYNASKIDI